MNRLIVLAVLCLSATPIFAQPVPSTFVPIGTACTLFDSRVGDRLEADSTTFILARGKCSIPETANAVAVTIVAFDPSGEGRARLMESSLPISAGQSGLYWQGGNGATSGNPVVRLCYPAQECSSEDLALWVSEETHILIRAEGYFEPLVN